MKQSFLMTIMIIFFLSFYYSQSRIHSTSDSKRAKRAKRTNSNLKSKLKQNAFNKVSFTNEGYMPLSDIASFGDIVWACTLNNTYYKYNPAGVTIQAAISGSSVFATNETCSRVATNSNGDLLVVTNLNNLNILKMVSSSSYSWSSISANISDVATGPLSDSYAITTNGTIFKLLGSSLAPLKFTTQIFGSNCKIAVNNEREPIVYVVDSSRNLWRNSLSTSTKVDIDTIPVDVGVGSNYNLYIASTTGIYRKKNNVDHIIKIADGIAGGISAGNKLWINGVDNFPYSAPLETPAFGI